MTESQILNTLQALGAKDTTSDVQKKNGTTCFTLPTGDCISEHKTGYIRKNLLNSNGGIYTCYQLNPTYKTFYKWVSHDGKVAVTAPPLVFIKKPSPLTALKGAVFAVVHQSTVPVLPKPV